jgi:predicted RNA binding protein YcfA (HicA-like mRNA interferase family)
MRKIPRDLTGLEFALKLSKFGYQITRQSGSHIRLTTNLSGEHHITIPAHDPLKVGTLSSILSAVSLHLGKSKKQLIEEVF